MQALLSNEPLSRSALILLGFEESSTGYFCPPLPADGGTYRLELAATKYIGGKPVAGTEEWRAYLPIDDCPTIRRFKVLGELFDFHKGMCGGHLSA